MRCLTRNKRRFWYALYREKRQVFDADGNATGEFEILHGNPVPGYASISAAAGQVRTELFGDAALYDKVICTDRFAPAMDERTVLWVDRVPALAGDGSLALDGAGEVKTPHDYIVTKVAGSLNGVSYAIRRVEVT